MTKRAELYGSNMPMAGPTYRNHLFSFAQGALVLHKNLMPCVIVGRDSTVHVSNDQDVLDADVICIKPDVPHRVIVGQGGADIFYFDGVRLAATQDDFACLPAVWKVLPSAFEAEDREAMARFRAYLDDQHLPPDRDVMKVIEQLYEAPLARMSQDALSQMLGLERTQALRHFKETTGQTFRKFKIWTGLIAAAHSAHQGEAIGLAGVDAGFSDAAHIARTAMTTFGLTPTQGLGGLIKMQTLH